MDDLAFVQRCIKGDKQAWNEFVERYSRLIYNYIYSVLEAKGINAAQETLDDLLQGIFFSLVKDNCKKLGTYRAKNGCSLASWLRQVTVNASLDYARKARPMVSLDAQNEEESSLKETLADDSEPVREALISEEKLEQLKDCIQELNTEDRYFLELHLHRGVSLKVLRAHFNLARGAVDMRKARIIGRLRDCFKTKGFLLDF
jgi:RNA polymerase sigma-70 factor (ECF subfamily)